MDNFLKRFNILKLNEKISSVAVQLIHQYRLSHGLLIADSLIAATAIYYQIPFLTKNRKDYVFIPELDMLPFPYSS